MPERDLKHATVQPRFELSPPFTVEAPGYKQVEGETIPRRHPKSKDALKKTPNPAIKTIYDIVTYSAEHYGNAKALGSRKLVKTHQETKKVKKMVDGKEETIDKKWTYFELSGFTYHSFNEYKTLTLELGSGLRKLGMESQDRVHIFAATSENWLATAHGAMSQAMPIVTAYDTLGEEGLKHSLVATKAKTIFLDPHLLTTLINPLKEAKDIRNVIYNSQNEVKDADIEKLKKAHDYLNIMSFEELRKLGEDNPHEPTPPKPEDLCCIMYTSGSTGTPKGVPLKHSNVIAASKYAMSKY